MSTCPLCFSESPDNHGYFMGKPCPRSPKPAMWGEAVITLADPNRVFEEYVERAERHELERIWEEEHSLKKPTTRELAKEIVQRRRQVEALQKLWRRTPYLGDWKI